MRYLKPLLLSVALFFAPILRFLGTLFLLGAVIAITADFSGSTSSAGFASLDRHLADIAPQTLAILKSQSESSIAKYILQLYLTAPAALSLGLTGGLLLWLGRYRRRARIFAN